MNAPYPYAWSWAEERARDRRKVRRRRLHIAAYVVAFLLLAGAALGPALLLWSRS